MRIVPLTAFIYLLCYLDRSNIGKKIPSYLPLFTGILSLPSATVVVVVVVAAR